MAENVFTLCLATYLNDTFVDDNKTKSHISSICEMA